MDSLELLANNLANAGTTGYKSDREFYGLFTSPDAANSLGAEFQTMLPVVQSQWTDFSQGTLQSTGNPLDVALASRGFLAVNGPHGVLYTRDGGLKIARSGDLVTADGYAVRAEGGKPIHITAGKSIEITTDGEVRQDGQAIGKFEIVDFASTDSLKKLSGACFQNTDPKNVPSPAANVQVEQGKIESSNVAVPEAAMRLVGMMRQFEMLQKAVTLDADMNRKAIEEVAHVGS
jgi:flagellar basal-body rod protein FlgF